MTRSNAPTETTRPDMAALIDHLEATEASSELMAWIKAQPDLQTAWAACKRSDWMLSLLADSTVAKNDHRFRLMAREFAKTLGHLPPGAPTLKPFEVAWNASWNAAWHAGWVAAAAAGSTVAEDSATIAARDAAWVAARDAARAAQAEIIRRYFPEFPEIST